MPISHDVFMRYGSREHYFCSGAKDIVEAKALLETAGWRVIGRIESRRGIGFILPVIKEQQGGHKHSPCSKCANAEHHHDKRTGRSIIKRCRRPAHESGDNREHCALYSQVKARHHSFETVASGRDPLLVDQAAERLLATLRGKSV